MHEPISASAAECIRFDGLTLDIGGRALLDPEGRGLMLTHAEFELLISFVRAPGRALSREHLLNAVAGRRFQVFDRSIDVLVGRLRHKIEPEPKAPRLIITVPGIGYKFVAQPRAVAAAVPADETAAAAPRPAERRQLTVVRCGIAGAGALAATLDPEDLQPTVAAFRACCVEVVERFGGIVMISGDDSVLAWFGYPEANEFDAERAIRAALAIITAAPKLRASLAEPIRARIGIASGLVIIGDRPGGGAPEEPAALGEAPHLAAALLSIAQPDTVLIGANTRRLTGELFELRALGPLAVAGFADDIQAWQVSGETADEGRFAALHKREFPHMVGRDEELRVLLHRWEQARGGAGRFVLIVGEPGIGKSRLLRAFLDRVPRPAPLRQFCSPHHSDGQLHPIIAHLARAAGFARTDTSEEKLAKLATSLEASVTNDEQIGLIGLLTGERYTPPELTHLKCREQTLAALLGQLRELAARQPMLVLYEDLHWIDPISLELLSLMVEQIASLPVLVLATARPEFRPPWVEEAHVTTMPLGRLRLSDTASLVAHVAGGSTPSRAMVEQIAAHSDGVPLFVEELTKAVLEPEPNNAERSANSADPDVLVPASLQSSLLARLDRLGPARTVTRIGAVIGREFGYELLASVTELPQRELQAALDRLTASGLAFQRGDPAEASFVFEHALVRDAAYNTLLRTERQRLHAKVADSIEQRFPEVAQTQPELLAYHRRASRAAPRYATHRAGRSGSM